MSARPINVRRKLRIPPKGKPVPHMTRLRLLAPERRDKIVAYYERHSGLDTVKWVEANFKIKTNIPCLSKLRNWILAQRDVEKRENVLERFEQTFSSANPDATREKVREMGLAIFLLDAADARDRKAFLEVLAQDLKEKAMRTRERNEKKRLSLAERRVALLEKKAAQADEAAAVVRSQLTPEEKQRRLDAIFAL